MKIFLIAGLLVFGGANVSLAASITFDEPAIGEPAFDDASGLFTLTFDIVTFSSETPFSFASVPANPHIRGRGLVIEELRLDFSVPITQFGFEFRVPDPIIVAQPVSVTFFTGVEQNQTVFDGHSVRIFSWVGPAVDAIVLDHLPLEGPEIWIVDNFTYTPVEIAAVPEPSTLGLMAVALAMAFKKYPLYVLLAPITSRAVAFCRRYALSSRAGLREPTPLSSPTLLRSVP